MNITMQFKATITTEETYPYSYQVLFKREVADSEDIFKEANEFIHLITKGQKLVSDTIECLGFTSIHHAKMWEMCELARQGIERYESH